MIGTIYLIHFVQKYKHAQHYIGFTTGLESRIAAHRKGEGSRLLQVVNGAGILWNVVRTWEGEKALERRYKNQKNAWRLCPVCKENCKKRI